MTPQEKRTLAQTKRLITSALKPFSAGVVRCQTHGSGIILKQSQKCGAYLEAVLPIETHPVLISERRDKLATRLKERASRHPLEIRDPSELLKAEPSTGVAFRDMVDATAFAVTREPNRETLKPLRVEWSGQRVELIATDGYRCAIAGAHSNKSNELKASIDPRSARLIGDGASLSIADSALCAEWQDGPVAFELSIPLIDLKYPNVRSSVPTRSLKPTTIDPDLWVTALSHFEEQVRVSAVDQTIFMTDEQSGVRTTSTFDVIEDLNPFEEFRINPEFLSEAIEHCPGAIKMHNSGSIEQVMLTSAGNHFDVTHAIMPLRPS